MTPPPPPVVTDAAPSDERPLARSLHLRLRDSSAPVLVVGDRSLPGASLWTAARTLVGDLRAAGLGPGDRVLVATEDDLLLATALVAGLTSGIAIALGRAPGASPGAVDTLTAVVEAVDARLALVSPDEHARLIHPAGDRSTALSPAAPGLPLAATGLAGIEHLTDVVPRPARCPGDPRIAVVLSTSGTTGAPSWVALSQANLAAVLDSHLATLFGDHWDAEDPTARPAGVMASVLSWSHAFGVVLDLLLGLHAAEVLLRDPGAAADPARLAGLLERAAPGARLNAVPVTLRRLIDSGRADLLQTLGGGVIGGARCDGNTATALESTRLRPGYGLTEAGPGVTLGTPGGFAEGRIGRPVGCWIDVHDDHVVVTGPNVRLGVLVDGVLATTDTPGSVIVPDLLRPVDDGWAFVGRTGDRVKLPNGRWADLAALETEIVRAVAHDCALAVAQDGGLVLVVDAHQDAAGEQALRRVCLWVREHRTRWAGYVRTVHRRPAADWPRTAKGELRRRELVPDGRESRPVTVATASSSSAPTVPSVGVSA